MLELCRVKTADGIQLDGMLQRPGADSTPRDVAFVLLHGTGSNFYGSGILAKVAEQALADGFPVLRVNTRGHDLAATLSSANGPVKGGAAYEHVLDCQQDVTAWCDFLSERGHARIVVIGHSLGGVKAIWSQALSPHPGVCGVVGISPPRFSHQRFQADPRFETFRQDYDHAKQLVSSGTPDALFTVKQPLPMLITAAGFLEKYGPEDRLNYLPVLTKIACPRLIVLGGKSVETNPAFDGLPEELGPLAQENRGLSFRLIPAADINYRNDPSAPWQCVRDWMEKDNITSLNTI